MSQKYHNSPDGPRPCDATVRKCTYGASEHFDSFEEAQTAFEVQQQAKHGVTTTLKKTPKGKPTYTKKQEDMWRTAAGLQRSIGEAEQRVNHLRFRTPHYDRAESALQRLEAAETMEYASQSARDGSIYFAGREVLKKLDRAEGGSTLNLHPSYPTPDLPNSAALRAHVERSRAAHEKELAQTSQDLAAMKRKQDALKVASVKASGFAENPRYGVPTGKTTSQMDFKRGNYNRLPTRDVPVLENSERFCTSCNEPVTHDSRGGTVHANGERFCKDDSKGSGFVNPNNTCRYCGTGDPSHLTSRQEAYADTTTCGRCGGVSGYGIGD